MSAKTTAIIIGMVFIAVGILGFFENPLVGPQSLFHTDTVHNIVHLVSGSLFLIVAWTSPQINRQFMKLFGIIYFIIGIVGFVRIGSDGMGEVLGFLHVNGADNFLHVGLGILIFLAGVISRAR